MFSISVLVLALFAIAIFWISYRFLEEPKSIAELITRIDLSRADRLFPFVEGRDVEHAWDDDLFMAGLGGLRGLDEMSSECLTVTAIATELRKHHPGFKTDAGDLRRLAKYLQWQIFAALLEDKRIRRQPALPRIQARSCARLYCDLATTLEIVTQKCQPTAAVKSR